MRCILRALNKSISALFLALFLFAPFLVMAGQPVNPQSGAELINIPTLTQRVTDLTGTLSNEQINVLDSTLKQFELNKGSQIAVLMINTTYPEDISQYSIRVVEKWKLGRSKVDDGVLLLIAKNDRRLRIEVGYGLEGALTDAASKRIISELIAPNFKKGLYFEGIKSGLDAIIALINQEKLPESSDKNQHSEAQFPQLDPSGILIIVFIGALFFGNVFRRILGAGFTAMVGGCLAAIFAWFLTQTIGISILAAFIGFIAALVSNVGGPVILGGSGPSSRDDYSNDRFSGGGGGFGGGGASGDW